VRRRREDVRAPLKVDHFAVGVLVDRVTGVGLDADCGAAGDRRERRGREGLGVRTGHNLLVAAERRGSTPATRWWSSTTPGRSWTRPG
jgi:hypothetical protein